MKIAYFIYRSTEHEDGVLKKIVRQARAWQEAGNEVHLFFLSPSTTTNPILSSFNITREIVSSKFSLAYKAGKLANGVLSWEPDLIYLRFAKYYPGLGKLGRTSRLVIEVNSNDLGQTQAKRRTLVYLYQLLSRNLILAKADGFCFITNEIASGFRSYQKPFEVIGDSTDLSQIESSSSPNNSNPRLVFVASRYLPWSGVDKITELAEHFPNWNFEIIGLAGARLPDFPPNTNLRGFLSGAEYKKVLLSADIAIGPLALYRINLQEAAPLKLREYLAYGLPCIIAHRDTDFMDGEDFLLQIPNRPGGVQDSFDRIEKFVNAWKGRRVARDKVLHLDVSKKEKIRLDLFHKILEGD